MIKRFLKIESSVSLASLTAIFAVLVLAACVGNHIGDRTTSPSGTPTPTASPVQTATATPIPTPNPCKATAIEASFAGGSQPNEILVTDPIKRLDATAKNAQGVISDGCNLDRSPEWRNLTHDEKNPALDTCAIIGSGWNPHLDGLKVGACRVEACLRQAGDGICFPPQGHVYLPGETVPVTSRAFEVQVK